MASSTKTFLVELYSNIALGDPGLARRKSEASLRRVGGGRMLERLLSINTIVKREAEFSVGESDS